MPSTDAHNLSEESLQLLCRQAHRLRHDMDLSWSSIAEIVGGDSVGADGVAKAVSPAFA